MSVEEARTAQREPVSREARLEEALRTIVEDANKRNEPGQAWDLVAGGLIDDAEALL